MYIKRLIRFSLIFAIVCFFVSCEADDKADISSSALPTTFTVDIPSSISRTATMKSGIDDEYSGREIYEHLNNFIHLGESAAKFVEDVMKGISTHELDKPAEFNFTSKDDGRTKHISVVDHVDYDGTTWPHQLTISDIENHTNDDGGKALQVFWNTNPISGIAIFKPANWEVNTEDPMGSAIFKVEYSEAGTYGYDVHMLVSITNWEDNHSDRFHMNELKMFVGKSGDIIDVYGNSIHPDAFLFLEEPKGFCWAFVASGNESSNIGVAEVGLPPHNLDDNSRRILLEHYSVENVFTEQIMEWVFQTFGVYPDEATIAEYLINTEAPGFFNSNGFVQGGETPSADYDELVNNIQLLTPFNPKSINEMTISFK